MFRMQARGPARLLRTAMAVVFGFMSLAHGPVMTFAKASPAPEHHAAAPASHGGHHQHHAVPDDQTAPGEHDAAPVCYAFGCFVAVDAAPVRAPAAILHSLGSVSPAPADTMLAGSIEPAVPPPRLHV